MSSSPFAALDRLKKKQQGITKPTPLKAVKAKSLSRSSSSLFDTLESFKPTREFLERSSSLHTLDSKRENYNTEKKSTLSSILRQQSKFTGKSSIITSKSSSRKVSASITKVKRELPWETNSTLNNHKSLKLSESNVIDNNNHIKKLVIPDDRSNKENERYLQGINVSLDGLSLSKEQQRVLDLILTERKNVFFTGSAGTGKSYLLKIIIQKLLTRYGSSSIGISAPTGLAAANIGGQTIFRLLGLGLGKEPVDLLLKKIKKNMDKYMTWRRMVVLIIDEISMLDSTLLEKLNVLAKSIKRSDKPFGGIQLIITGDFLQLPPVDISNSTNINYCFKSQTWNEIIDESVVLTQVFRQNGDPELIEILNALRVGRIDHRVESKLRHLSRALEFDDGVVPTELFPTRHEVERSNLAKLEQLDGPEISYKATDLSINGAPVDEMVRKSLDMLMCVPELKLKIGAQVMLIQNDVDDRLANGQLGLVECFLTKPIYRIFASRFGKDYDYSRTQVLRKVGQMLLNKKGLTNNPEYDDLSLLEENNAVIVDELLKNFNPEDDFLPLVTFTTANALQLKSRPVQLLVETAEFKPDPHGKYSNGFTRHQLPLILAWSMSIHKSQGQTLPRVRVDLKKVFEKGQLYVAISRCVSSHGLQVLNFDRRKVFVDQEVIEFYDKIS